VDLAQASKYAEGRHGKHLAPVSLRAAILRGALKGHKVGGIWEVNKSDLDKYLSSRPRWWKPGSSEYKYTKIIEGSDSSDSSEVSDISER
jgi:hypothetical protein